MINLSFADLTIKLAGHPEDRLLERTTLNKKSLDPVKKGLIKANLPAGSHHVRLPGGSYAVLKDISKKGGQKRHVVATVLSEDMSPPGYDVTYDVMGVDPDDVRVINFSEGPNARRKNTYSASERSSKDGYSFSETKSLSSVKVAMIDMKDVTERLESLRHDKGSLKDYENIVRRQSRLIDIDPRGLPEINPPSNNSEQTKAELSHIVQVMADKPLSDRFVSRSSSNVNEVFYDMCDVFDLDAQPEVAEDLAADIMKLAMYLKYKYLRPRPYQIAAYHDKGVVGEDMDAEGSPSYPSGHSMVGYALAKLYSDLYPKYADEFERLGTKVALARIQAGVHFPSDTEYAKLLIDSIFE